MNSGWKDVYSAPSWLVQGYQEYLGLPHGDDYSKGVTLKSYVDQFKANRDRIKISADGIAVENDYYDRTVPLHFFYSKFGKERTHRVLTSAKTSLSEALRIELGSYAKIAAEFSAWGDSL
jgi:hypothetical protein